MATAAHTISPSALTGIWLPTPTKAPRSWSGTPEVYFTKTIDNSRLVRVADGKRNREMGLLAIALCVLFALVMVYAWQHFRAVEYGYKIEALRAQRNNLSEANRALQLEAASLSDPERIDALARQMGLSSPQPGQVMRLEPSTTDGAAEPVMARVSDRMAEIAVVSAAQ